MGMDAHIHTHTHPAYSRQTFEGKYDLENECKNTQIANVILNIEKNNTKQNIMFLRMLFSVKSLL